MTLFPARAAASPAAYAAAMKAKLKRDRESFAAFRKVDQEQHDRAHEHRVTSAVAAAEDDLRLWREDVEMLEPEAAEALAVFRAAEDRAREAAEFARQQRAAYDLAKGRAPAAEETDLLIHADSADTVAAGAAEVMESRQAELSVADAALAEAREGLATAERHLDQVRAAVEGSTAGEAPLSDVTIRACAGYLQTDEVWNTLSRDVRFRLHYLAEPRAVMSDPEWHANVREALDAIGGGA